MDVVEPKARVSPIDKIYNQLQSMQQKIDTLTDENKQLKQQVKELSKRHK